MNVKISEMPSATSLDGTELVPIVQSGVSKKTTTQELMPSITWRKIYNSNHIRLDFKFYS